MIFVFYSNDPVGHDQGGGVEHFRGIYRALSKSTLNYRLIASRNLEESSPIDGVVYISTGSSFFLYYIALWRWFLFNRKHFRKQDVFHFHRNYAIWPKLLFAGSIGRTIITYHGLTGNVLRHKVGFLARPIRWLMRRLESRALNYADQIIFVSDRDRQAMKGDLLGDNYKKTCVIPAAFNAQSFFGSTPPPPNLANKVLMVGRLSEIKNIPLAIDAICHLREAGVNMVLTIVGEGEDRPRLEDYLRERACENLVALTGKVAHDRIPYIMSQHGIVLLTSWSEASPTVVKEAIAAHRPIVTTDVGDVRLWVHEGQNGFIRKLSADAVADGLNQASAMVKLQTYEQTVDLSDFSEDTLMGKVLDCYCADSNKDNR